MPRTLRPLAVTAAATAAALLPAAPPPAHAGSASGPITFGIYPGGGAGTFGPADPVRPEDPARRLAALNELRGGARPFVLHLYDDFTERDDSAAVPGWLAEQIDQYTAAGFQIELVLRYRPRDPAGDVAGYAAFVRSRVQQLGPNRRVTALQVTNEVNVTVAPDAADGAYPGAGAALVDGVVAAKREVRRGRFGQIKVGFNWAFQQGPSEDAFWSSIRRRSNRRTAFARSVDWVGLDAYPGTWGPWLPSKTLAAGARRTTYAALELLRRRYLPMAGLRHVSLRLSEAGYPTGPGRSEEMQRVMLRTITRAVVSWRRRFGITDYRWFNLRDAQSSSVSFESQYGLMRDDYSPKAAFRTYRDLIATLGRRASRAG